jgi:hypothetical protein
LVRRGAVNREVIAVACSPFGFSEVVMDKQITMEDLIEMGERMRKRLESLKDMQLKLAESLGQKVVSSNAYLQAAGEIARV